MAGFAKIIPFFSQLFPASGSGDVPAAREVTDVVHLTHELWTPRFVHGCRLRRDVLTGVGTGAGINLTHVEPDKGFFQVVTGWTVWHDNGAAGQGVSLEYVLTTTELDAWGRWDTLARAFARIVIPASTSTGTLRTRTAPIWFPIPVGMRLQAGFVGVPAGINVRSHLWWVDVPGELLQVQDFSRHMNQMSE